MADQVLSTNPADFAIRSTRWEGKAMRVRVRDADGDHDAYQLPDGTIVNKALRAPSAAKATENTAIQTAETQERTRNTNAINACKTFITAWKGAGATAVQRDNAIAAVIYLLLRER